MNIIGWVLTGSAVFLILDGLLAIILGMRYMMWGLEYVPAWYRSLMKKIYRLPGPVQFLLKLAEVLAGLYIIQQMWFPGK